MEGEAAKPYESLAVKNAKHALNCTELHLANKNIGWLQGFDPFLNLQVLWLNDNKLRKLTNLEKNFRLRALYVHNNQLTTLKDSSVPHLAFVEELTMFSNHLEDLHATLKVLARLRHLKHLDMFGNPLAEEKDYRLHVIKLLPHLEVLDRHVITEQERDKARLVKPPDLVFASAAGDGRSRAETGASLDGDASVGGGAARGRTSSKGPSRDAAVPETATTIEEVIAAMKARATEKRLLIKPFMQDVDPRREHRVLLTEFERILSLHELWPSSATEVALLLAKYERPPPQRCATLGRDAHYAERGHRWVDYIAYCGDIEPHATGRDTHHQALVQATEWRAKVPERSVGVQDLEREVGGVRQRLAAAEHRKRQAMVGLSMSSAGADSHAHGGASGGAAKKTSFEVGENELEHYEAVELKKLMKQYDRDGNNMLSRGELKECLENMEMAGRKFSIGTSSADDLKGYAKTVEDVEQEAKLDPETLFNMLFEAFDGNDDGKIDWNEFHEGIMCGVKDPATGLQLFPPLQWAWLSADEADAKSKQLFADAEKRQHRHIIAGAKDKAEQAKIAQITSSATKLQQLAEQQRGIAKSDSDADTLQSRGPSGRGHDLITLKVALPELHAKKKVSEKNEVFEKTLPSRAMRDAHLTQPLARSFKLGRSHIAKHDGMIQRDRPKEPPSLGTFAL